MLFCRTGFSPSWPTISWPSPASRLLNYIQLPKFRVHRRFGMANDHRVRSAVRPPLQVAAIFRKVCQLANHDDSASSQLVIFTNLYICDPEITEIKGRRIALVADEGLDIGGWKYRYCPPLGVGKKWRRLRFTSLRCSCIGRSDKSWS